MIGINRFTSYYARDRELRNLVQAAKERAFRLVQGDLLELNLEELLLDSSL